MISQDEWIRILAELAAHFPATSVQWRPQGDRENKVKAGARVRILAYLDARAVQDRLDAACPGLWSFDWSPVHIDAKGIVTAAKGVLTIASISRADIGTMSSWDPSKGAVSDALKRSAVHFGVGRYLYDLPDVYAVLDGEGKVSLAMLAKLAMRLEELAARQAVESTCVQLPEHTLAAAGVN